MRPAKILVVEDNRANLTLMVYLLRAFGYTAETALDGEEVMEFVRRENFDLIICDVQLPKLDGFGVARRLKDDPALREIPLVAVTALAMVGDRDKVLAAGFDGYISKPIQPQTFVKQVEVLLRPEQRAEPCKQPAASAPRRRVYPRLAEATIILVIDDSPANISLARSTLEPFGYEVIAAATIDEAREIIGASPPHLILSDLHLSRESGFALLKTVRDDPRRRSIPFVFLSSSHYFEDDRTRALALGADKFLLRPIEPRALVDELSACLQKHSGIKHG